MCIASRAQLTTIHANKTMKQQQTNKALPKLGPRLVPNLVPQVYAPAERSNSNALEPKFTSTRAPPTTPTTRKRGPDAKPYPAKTTSLMMVDALPGLRAMRIQASAKVTSTSPPLRKIIQVENYSLFHCFLTKLICLQNCIAIFVVFTFASAK